MARHAYIIGLNADDGETKRPRLLSKEFERIAFDKNFAALQAFLDANKGTFVGWHTDTKGNVLIGDAVIIIDASKRALLEKADFVARLPVPGDPVMDIALMGKKTVYAHDFN